MKAPPCGCCDGERTLVRYRLPDSILEESEWRQVLPGGARMTVATLDCAGLADTRERVVRYAAAHDIDPESDPESFDFLWQELRR